ncbi:hypothetical protein AAIH46_17610, partial [Rhizobium sp. 0TCS1.26]|uniref:hypothetical protein n=1 Tax=Rhizobium sp. 0TCS1.26 TaxID=3142623 RepID=UPI003D27170C
QNHQDQTVTRPSISISQSYMISFQENPETFRFSPERKTSSLAAPPPSSVIGVIDPHFPHVNNHRRKNFRKFVSG